MISRLLLVSLMLFATHPLWAQAPPDLVAATDLLVLRTKMALAQPGTGLRNAKLSTTEGADDVEVLITGYYTGGQLRLLLFKRSFEAGMRGYDKQTESSLEFVLHRGRLVYAEKIETFVAGNNPSAKGARQAQRYYFQNEQLRYYSEHGLPDVLHDDIAGRDAQEQRLLKLFKQCRHWLKNTHEEKLEP